MPRPRCCRRIGAAPTCRVFKPAGTPLEGLEQVRLALEEYEAVRLADLEGLYQEDAAARMGVSRQTFGRTVGAARAKIARALVLGLALRIEIPQDDAEKLPPREFLCPDCGYFGPVPCADGWPEDCPGCGNRSFRRKRRQGPGPVAQGARKKQSCPPKKER
ncbi:Predicted DNA-binding protein, UPF0251 family [Humidesulfovibrio mexicanus]|uniref:UPF0251 protein SAMN04488503_2543 n=1 Tax=Humidesulfovibrio mexicanus TaxID=147047 RepID=A0A239BFU8_9BACT|nr:DUF134 domain-containing protein [Humidesulfovibrio mexicanus]SNS06706.1 Predicted DNA-binding protein, UPF0251 family [Humidesulfovibrio mexicanus]